MKFLHLADLHIGKTVNGFSMLEEQKHVLEQVIGYIQTERPEAILIAGDVYDRSVPGVEAVTLLDDFLTAVAAEAVPVILISGNHDSAERLNFASRLLTDRRLYLRGVFDGRLEPVVLRDEYGPVNFWPLPFIKPSAVRAFFPDKAIDSYSEAIAAVLEAAQIDYTARNVLISHQFYTAAGVAPVRSDSEIDPVGGLDAADAGLLSGFDYVALGHLHGAQRVGSEAIRYAGSPLKYSFSECRQHKACCLVELGEKGSLAVAQLPFSPIHDMRQIKGPLDSLLSLEILAQGDPDDYMSVTLTDETEVVDAMGKIRTAYPNVMALDFENTRSAVNIAEVSAEAEVVGSLSPFELFGRFFEQANASAMSEAQAVIVRELLETEADK
jgi:exonuclease SbcD